MRLKGGDPFVFGRGGEETDFLERAGVRVVAVPGIMAAAGVAAALGIPLTMRGYATSVRYVTGHVTAGVNLDVGPVDINTTYVVYMGLGQLDAIANQLVRNGLPHHTPAVAVQCGTTPQQRVLAAPLAKLHALVADARFQSPTLIVIGAVVSLASCWIDHAEQAIEGDGTPAEDKLSFGQLGLDDASHGDIFVTLSA